MRAAVLDYLLNAGWQLALIAAGTFLLSRLLRLAPPQACRLWLAAFGLAVLAPVLAIAAGGGAPDAAGQGALSGWLTIAIPPRLAVILSIGFWLCLAAAALRLVASCLVAIRLVNASRPVWLPGEVRESLEDFCRAHGRALPRIHTCDRITSPVVVGVRRPYVLVPPGVLAEGPDALRPALLHELAHVIRGDYATNLMVELFALPLAWHPALHGIKAMIRLTREQSCDAIAAARMGCRHRYAQSLLALARQAIAPAPVVGASLPMFGDGDLNSRVALLAATGERRRLSGAAMATAIALFLSLGAIVTTVHVSAQAPLRQASSRPAAKMAAQPVVASTVRLAKNEMRVRKSRSHVRNRVAAQPDAPAKVAQVTLTPEVANEDAGGAGPFDFLQSFQPMRYRTVYSP